MGDFVWGNFFRRSDEKVLQQKLKGNYLFQDLSYFQLRFLEKIVCLRSYRSGENIFRQGDVGVGMYVISQGLVSIYGEKLLPESGEVNLQLITELKEGDFFGEMALVEENSRRTATAIASQEVVLIGLFKPDLMEIMERNPRVGVKILFRLGEILGRRLKEAASESVNVK